MRIPDSRFARDDVIDRRSIRICRNRTHSQHVTASERRWDKYLETPSPIPLHPEGSAPSSPMTTTLATAHYQLNCRLSSPYQTFHPARTPNVHDLAPPGNES